MRNEIWQEKINGYWVYGLLYYWIAGRNELIFIR